jgi:uncharacterized membrane protein
MPSGIAMNLVLSVVPVALGYALAWGLGRGLKQPYLKLLVGVPLALAWLALLPNTCYLLTEWRQLLLDPPAADLIAGRGAGQLAMLRTARWALYFLLYAGAGVLLVTLAIRPVEQWLRGAGRNPLFAAPFLFFLVSLGVYLALGPGLTSWDLFSRPLAVARTARGAFSSTPLLLSIAAFAVLLWALYEGTDVWVEGMAARLRGLRSGAKSGAAPKSSAARKK